jgi:heptosyltransferase II
VGSGEAITVPERSPSSILHPRRVLIRGVNWLGDAVMTTPALQRLREALADSHITLLTHEKLAGLWRQHPSLDAFITFTSGESVWKVARRLRAGHFEAALILPNSPRATLEAWLARIPQRAGYTRPWRTGFLTHPVAPRRGTVRMHRLSGRQVGQLVHAATAPAQPAARVLSNAAHHIHEYLHLAAALGANPDPLAPKLEVTAAEVLEADQALLSAARKHWQGSACQKPLILLGVNPGAEYGPAKRWPAASFAGAADRISQRVDHCAWLLFGTAGDRALCSEIAQGMRGRVLDLAGRTSLRQLMALLKLCRVLLSNDTGPMHLAAALGTPVVVPFGSTAPELTGPGLPGDLRHRLLKSAAPCSPCFRRTCPIDFRCMTGITVDRVVSAVLDALG